MLELVIHKTADSEEIPVFLTLPSSRWDELEVKARLGMASLNGCHFEFEPPQDLPQAGSILKAIRRGPYFWNVRNYFSQQITQMNHSTRMLLNGTIAIHSPEDMKTLINLAHRDQSEIVVAEACNLVELGGFLVEYNMVKFPEEVIPYLDFAKIGEEHRANHRCAFDRNLYYEDLAPEIPEVYDGRSLPQLNMPDHVFAASVFNLVLDPNETSAVKMNFSASQSELDQIKRQLGAQTMGVLLAVVQGFPITSLEGLLDEPVVPMIDLDVLASGIDRLDDARYIKLLAVMEAERACSIYDVISCIHRLDAYKFTPGIRPEDVGSYGLVSFSGHEQAMAQAPLQEQDRTMEMGGM